MKYYLVTGASSGIGRQVAKELSNNETMLILVARRKEKLEELQCELNGDSLVIPCDLYKEEDIEHVFEVLHNKKIKLSGMVYCAGICTITPIKAMDMDALKDMFQINVFAFYQMCKCFAQRSVSEKGSVIVGVSS